ncbi:ExbD/TolR family protein [Croceicoccus pelagius]|uniref:Biopolymer transporter n=1 Tax=Croceicoccus pelagius TaxID=1703341 RepID=A0A916YFZ6_9SPHN|nr:biopolymer transporter ExbD [Croceicoccus pelagius]GGD41828.1 biopolymer transporter [Croceicoccus pelagius]
MALSLNADSQPMMEMNTTPLIDVMLVLLIMFIITIPIATHQVPIDLPGKSAPVIGPLSPVKNKVVLTSDDRILWNGTEVTREGLAATIDQSLLLNPEPELQFEPAEAASYDASAKVLRTIRQSGATKFGFVGNERFREFESGPKGVNAMVSAN